MEVLRDELEGDCVIMRTGDFCTSCCCCCWLLSLVSIDIEGVVERTGSAGDLIGRSIGEGLLCGCCCCWTNELEDSFLLKPFVLTSFGEFILSTGPFEWICGYGDGCECIGELIR